MSDDDTLRLALRFLGAFIGVIASIIMIAPEHSRAAMWRVLVGLVMGFIFAPTVPHWPLFGALEFLEGDTTDLIMARSAACGFSIWFILEFIARFLAKTGWWESLLRSVIEARSGGKK